MFFFLCLQMGLSAEKIHYHLSDDPIDVVIVCHPKDKQTLGSCISGIKRNCRKIRRIIVVSDVKLTDKAEWFDEKLFPFNKNEIAAVIGRGSKKRIKKFFSDPRHSQGWYFQQLLKLYSPFVIPDISPNVLIIDADAVFMNHVKFLNHSHGALFCFRRKKGKLEYFRHAQRLVPGLTRVNPNLYTVCHHMLFQRPILEHLFSTVENHHHAPFWVAFCSCVDLKKKNGGASEYEIYSNFALSHTNQVRLRRLKWKNSGQWNQRHQFKKHGYHFVAFHTYLR
jgi:hypothetical protein